MLNPKHNNFFLEIFMLKLELIFLLPVLSIIKLMQNRNP